MAPDIKVSFLYAAILYISFGTMQMASLPYRGYDPYTARDSQLNNYLKSVLDPMKEQMRNGMPQYGLPVLDPLILPNISKSYSSDKANATMFIQDPTITGLSNFTLLKLDAHLRNLTVDIRVVFPKIMITSEHYQLSGNAANIIPLVGDGRVSIHIKDVQVDLSVRLIFPSSGNLKIEDINIDLDFARVSVFFEELMGGGSLGDFINVYLSSSAKKYFLMYKPALLEKASALAKQRANKALSKFKLGNFSLS